MDIKITSHVPETLAALEQKIDIALEACGLQATAYSQQNITAAGRVDTGVMRNSMTHLVQGHDCYVGTNIEYAKYQEAGTSRGIKPAHFLRDAIGNHITEYQTIIRTYLEK